MRSLDWLVSVQSSPDRQFAAIGSNGFYARGAAPAAFDQQPVEACAMVSACLDAYRVHDDRRWLTRARWAFNWFLGENHLQHWLFDAVDRWLPRWAARRSAESEPGRRGDALVPARPARVADESTALDVAGVPRWHCSQHHDVATDTKRCSIDTTRIPF